VEDSGQIQVFSSDSEAAEKAVAKIRQLTKEAEWVSFI